MLHCTGRTSWLMWERSEFVHNSSWASFPLPLFIHRKIACGVRAVLKWCSVWNTGETGVRVICRTGRESGFMFGSAQGYTNCLVYSSLFRAQRRKRRLKTRNCRASFAQKDPPLDNHLHKYGLCHFSDALSRTRIIERLCWKKRKQLWASQKSCGTLTCSMYLAVCCLRWRVPNTWSRDWCRLERFLRCLLCCVMWYLFQRNYLFKSTVDDFVTSWMSWIRGHGNGNLLTRFWYWIISVGVRSQQCLKIQSQHSSHSSRTVHVRVWPNTKARTNVLEASANNHFLCRFLCHCNMLEVRQLIGGNVCGKLESIFLLWWVFWKDPMNCNDIRGMHKGCSKCCFEGRDLDKESRMSGTCKGNKFPPKKRMNVLAKGWSPFGTSHLEMPKQFAFVAREGPSLVRDRVAKDRQCLFVFEKFMAVAFWECFDLCLLRMLLSLW